MPFSIIREDITKLNVEAIVNAANTELLMGGGVCGAIFSAAGITKMQKACNALAPIKTGEAVITQGFALHSKYVIHTVGPIYCEHSKEENEKLLRLAYKASLELAKENKCESIAFPLISSGIYGYPKEEALNLATSVIREFLHDNDMDIYLAVFDRESFIISHELYSDVESYIDENYVDTHYYSRRSTNEKSKFGSIPAPCCESSKYYADTQVDTAPKQSVCMQKSICVDDLLVHLDESFSNTLLRLIDAKGKTDVEVYKKANIDRKLFSKIRTGKGYMPSKRTIIALSVALELSLSETDDLLERAGYALSHSQKFDVIVEYFIINGKYDVFEINEVLFKYDQPLLGCSE